MTLADGTNPVDPIKVDLPSPERVRLSALYRYSILDTPPEPQFDRLVELAARFFDMPMALISLSPRTDSGSRPTRACR